MIDFALHPITRDLVLFPRPLDGAARVAQAIGIRLRTWLGEWFLNTTHGVPYMENILIKNARPEIVEAILRNQILGVAGVRSIQVFRLDLNNAARTAQVYFEVSSLEGLATGNLDIRV